MPIYAPSLPPRPELSEGSHPIQVLAKFDLRRVVKRKVGFFIFGFIFLAILLIELIVLYVKYLINTSPGLGGLKEFANKIMTQGADYQAGLIDWWMLVPLWFMMAFMVGGIISRDSLYRIRPLVYAHPVRPQDYITAKALSAFIIPMAVMLPFVLLPWGLSLAMAGKAGPIWVSAPLYLLPAAIIIALLMAAVTLGASAMAGSPRASFGWVLGIVLGTSAIGGIFTGALQSKQWMAMSPYALVQAWPQLIFNVGEPLLKWAPTLAGTILHIAFWTWIAVKRTKPSEAVL
ncbi:MAG: hypothetical protein IPQ13_05930 [Holophagaceae bacterium]|nr:hypothetical protein [Holophagaceae bacterium]